MQQMSLNDYQKEAARTLIDRPDSTYTDAELMLVWNTLGLVGEAAEIAELVGKRKLDNMRGVEWRAAMRSELGDLMWYVAAIATHQGWTLQSLADRFPPDVIMGDADWTGVIRGLALRISARAGDVADLVKKGVFHRQPFHAHAVEINLGKILGMVARLADDDMVRICAENIEKLKIRYPDGWSSADAEARVDVEPERR